MRTAIRALLLSVLISSSFASAQKSPDGKGLAFNIIGFERYRDLVPAPDHRERWSALWCSEKSEQAPSCRVTVVRIEGCSMHYPNVFESEHTTEDGNLVVSALDWDHGRLALRIQFENYSSTCTVHFTRTPLGRWDLVSSASCSWNEVDGNGKSSLNENRLPARSYAFQPPCGYWLMGADNKQQPLPAP